MGTTKTLHKSRFWQLVKQGFSSNKFMYLVLGLFVFQCLWVAISFKFPMVFDERYHFEVSEIYSHQLSPIISNQAPQYDIYGNLTFGSASLYHYVFSILIRAINLFHPTLYVKVILLRVANIVLVSLGLYLFARVFRLVGLPKVVINLSLLFFITIPSFILVSSTISYDNLLFLLVAVFLSYVVTIIQSDKLDTVLFAKFFLVGMTASLVKFSFLPIFILGFIGIAVNVIQRGVVAGKLKRDVINSMRLGSIYRMIFLGVSLVIVMGLFCFRYVYPTIRYHSPLPQCNVVMQEDRCRKSGVYLYESRALETKKQRMALPIQIYGQNWSQTILLQLDTSAAVISEGKVEFGKSLPIDAFLISIAPVIGILVLIYSWKSLKFTNSQIYLLVIATAIVLSTFIFNIVSYYSVNADLNVQARYLLIPIFIFLTFSMYAINSVIGGRHKIKLLCIVLVLFLISQGGGLIKHILTSQDSWYMQDKTVILVNESAKKILAPWVKE